MVSPPDSPVVQHWQRSYADLVANARYGAPTALAITLRWARAEVEWADLHGSEPKIGAPPH